MQLKDGYAVRAILPRPEGRGLPRRQIKAGWTLVAIVSGTRYVNGQLATGPVYVLAHTASKRPTL